MQDQKRADVAYATIQDLIVLQRLAPGSLVSESEIMAITGLGRTPVREALQRLARDHMVMIHPNKGVLVPPLSIEAELKALEVRRVLESLAVELACTRASDEDRSAMRDMIERIDHSGSSVSGYMQTVAGTHALIVAGAHNPYLADAMAPLQGLSRRFWLAYLRRPEAEIKIASGLHRNILQAILNEDAESGREASVALNDYLVDFSLRTVREP
ncbi:MAG: GntR family transcriptional regulator [Actinomycetota bacterium]|nr:GntR family transcriptional regulator [Actinomycetota bacterium]MDA8396321.1 GntR family transcriptional regulator [Actinomycetota bacterium]